MKEGESVVDAEVSDEGDRVAIGISNGRQLYAFVYCLNRPRGETPSGDIGDVAVQVVDGEVQQG